MGKNNVSNYSKDNFLVVPKKVDTSLDLRSGSDIYTIKELLYISSSGFTVSYNNDTGQISVSGGSYSFKYVTHHSTDPANYIGYQNTITRSKSPDVYFITSNIYE